MFSLDGGRIRIEAEAPRVRALRELETLDSAAERVFDEIARAAAGICETPIALVSLVDGHRQWFKARVGLDFTEADRAISFCSHAIESASELLVVRDTTADARFSRNTLVTGSPRLRFFAGAPLIVNGFTIGTLCVLDTKPRRLNARQKQTLTEVGGS